MKFWFGFALGVLGCVGCTEMTDLFSKSPLTPDQAASVVDEGAIIAGCENEGRDAKDAGQPDAYGTYDDCMREAGVR